MTNIAAGKGTISALSVSQQKFHEIVNVAKTKQQAKWGVKYKPKVSTMAAVSPVSQPMKTRLSDTGNVTRTRGGFYV